MAHGGSPFVDGCLAVRCVSEVILGPDWLTVGDVRAGLPDGVRPLGGVR